MTRATSFSDGVTGNELINFQNGNPPTHPHKLVNICKNTNLFYNIFSETSEHQLIFKVHPWVMTEKMITHPNALGHLMLDPTWFRSDIGSPGKGLPNIMANETTDELEIIGRTYCFQIYKRRHEALSLIDDDSDSETDCDDTYSLHDTTSDESTDEETEL